MFESGRRPFKLVDQKRVVFHAHRPTLGSARGVQVKPGRIRDWASRRRRRLLLLLLLLLLLHGVHTALAAAPAAEKRAPAAG